MRFGQLIAKLAIPEWRACYINYHLLKTLLKLFIVIGDAREHNQHVYGTQHTDNNPEHAEGEINSHNTTEIELQGILEESNKLFFRLHREEMYVTFMFFQLKLIQIKDKLRELERCTFIEKGNEQFLYMLDNIYIEVSYVRNLYQINLEGQRKILKKHKKTVKDLNLATPTSQAQRILRLVPLAKELQDTIEEIYISKSSKSSKTARLHLRELIESQQQDAVGSFFFGVGIGIGVSIIGLIIALQQLNLPTLDTDPIFSRDFPVWRGIGFFVIYMWVLALNVYLFEQHHINHKLIFKFTDYHASTSTEAFYRASIFSAVYLILFLLYIIQRVYNTDFFPDARIYLGGIVWIMFIVYIIFPFKLFNWKGRLYMWKVLVLCIIFPFQGVTFPIIWTTDQFISLVSPLKDFAYTICYYTQLDLKNSTSNSRCSNSIEVVFVAGCIALMLRIFQCMKVGYDNRNYFGAPAFYNTLKYLSSLLTLLFSYLYTSAQTNIFAAWVVFAVISTLFSFYWDIKHDWGLLEKSRKNPFLRDNLCYGDKRLYYFLGGLNLLFRLSWVFTLSPNIVRSFGIMPVLFNLITGSLEILRRGLWSLLRVEKEHLANCAQFRAISNINPKDLLANAPEAIDASSEPIYDERRDKLIKTLKASVAKKNELMFDVEQFVSRKRKEVKKLVKVDA